MTKGLKRWNQIQNLRPIDRPGPTNFLYKLARL
jgi:hypothetical protein